MTWTRCGLTVLIGLVVLTRLTFSQPRAASASGPVTYEHLVQAEAAPENWLMYAGQYSSQRHSRLKQIDQVNVADLEVKWAYQLRTLTDVETSPLVVDGVMYLTQSPSNIIAIDAATGRPFWTYEHELPEKVSVSGGSTRSREPGSRATRAGKGSPRRSAGRRRG